MSKSKGNGVDPEDIIHQYGADSLRFSIAQMATETQDVRVPVQFKCPHCGELTPQTAQNMMARTLPCSHCKKTMATRWAEEAVQQQEGLALLTSDKFEIGRNFANKIWNASRFAMMNLEPGIPLYTPAELYEQAQEPGSAFSADEHWILERLAQATNAVTNALDGYHFHDYAQCMYDFLWNEFCDWYLEAVKPVLRDGDHDQKHRAQTVLACVLNTSIRLLHPVMPFLSEEIWRLLHEITGTKTDGLLIKAAWPAARTGWCDEGRLNEIDKKYILIGLGRSLRSEFNIPPSAQVRFAIKPEKESTAAFLAGELETLKRFLHASAIEIDTAFEPLHPLPSQITSGASIYLFLDSALDMEAEAQRIGKQHESLVKYITALEKKLANEKFIENAPADVIDKEKEKLNEAREKVEKLDQMRAYLSA
jgi:valyl-tRNA synthetase